MVVGGKIGIKWGGGGYRQTQYTIQWANAGFMVGQRRSCWTNIDQALAQWIELAGNVAKNIYDIEPT